MFFRKKYPTANFIAFMQALGLVVYVGIVSILMVNGEELFGKAGPFTPMLVLLLFVTSALICGILALGYPIVLFLNKQKKAAVKLILYTAGWLIIFVSAVLIFVASF